jgi:zinc/manganese transport system substrate-binding protein
MRNMTMLLTVLLLAVTLPAQAALNVVSTTQDLAAIAQAVGGRHVTVASLTPGGSDPHFAEAKPSMIRRAHDADLLLAVGASLEVGWLPALLQASRNSRILPGADGHLDVSLSIKLLDKPIGPVSRADGDVHLEGNPHYWLDPENGLAIAAAIAARLKQLDPAHVADYEKQLAAFNNELRSRLRGWRERLAWLKGQPAISYHKSFVYLAAAFGFRVVAEIEPKPGIPPSPAYLRQLVERIRAQNVRLLIMEPFYERGSAAYLGEHAGIRMALVPQSVGATPEIKTYFDLFDAVVASLNQARGS